MKIRRFTAIELLQGLRSLDTYKFSSATVEKIVLNIVKLRSLAEEVAAYREALAKQLGVPNPNDPASLNFREFDRQFGQWLTQEDDQDVIPIPPIEWEFDKNYVSITTRERLVPIVAP